METILIQRNEEDVNTAYSGDNIRVKLKGVEEEVCVCGGGGGGGRRRSVCGGCRLCWVHVACIVYFT